MRLRGRSREALVLLAVSLLACGPAPNPTAAPTVRADVHLAAGAGIWIDGTTVRARLVVTGGQEARSWDVETGEPVEVVPGSYMLEVWTGPPQ